MSRYIDADKVLAEFPIRRNHYDEKNGNIHFINGIETVMEYIDTVADEQPADVQEVKHGKWIDYGWRNRGFDAFHIFKCSECNRGKIKTSRFCPNCGAKMDGKE